MKKDVSGDYVLFSDVDAAMDLVGQLSDRADNFAVAGSDIPLSDDKQSVGQVSAPPAAGFGSLGI